MDIRNIKLFLTLSNNLHFARTARQMHVSPSTLSRAMQRLEQEVGAKLFERDNRQVTLTTAGVEYRHFAAQTLDNFNKLSHRLDPTQDQLKGRLNLYCSVTAAYSHLPRLLDRFRSDHPLVEIALTTGDAANAVDIVRQNQADISIAALPQTLPESLQFIKIDDIALVVIAPTFQCAVQELLTEPIICWDSVPFIIAEHGLGRRRIEQWFKQLGLNANVYAQVSGHEAIASMVALGCGVSIVPEIVIQNSPVKDRIKQLASPVDIAPFELGCCSKKSRQDDPIINAFLKNSAEITHRAYDSSIIYR